MYFYKMNCRQKVVLVHVELSIRFVSLAYCVFLKAKRFHLIMQIYK